MIYAFGHRAAWRRMCSRGSGSRMERAARDQQHPHRRLRLEPLEDRCLLAAGDLDATFGGGLVATAVGSGAASASGMAIQSDGKIVVVGSATDGSNTDADFAVVRYNTNGTLDSSFSGDGRAFARMGSYSDTANAVAIQSDGKIVVAGKMGGATYSLFGVARFNTDGSLDTSFSGDGMVYTSIMTGSDIAEAVAVQSDGKVVVAGWGQPNSGTQPDIDDVVLVRYTSAGALDTSFESDGMVSTSVGSYGSTAHALAIQSDGKIVLAGSTDLSATTNWKTLLLRYNTNGYLDSTGFGNAGKVVADLAWGVDYANDVKFQSDGKILTAGHGTDGSGEFFSVARFGTSGALDTTWDGDGVAKTYVGSLGDSGNSLAVQADGKVVAAGRTEVGSTDYDCALVRYASDGSLDGTFGSGGKVVTRFGTGSDAYAGVAIDAAGRVVAAGTVKNGSVNNFAAARYQGDGPTTSGIGNVVVDENSAPTAVNLFLAFQDATDADASMTYTLRSNSNPSLFSSTTIHGTAGTFTLAYAANTVGTTTLTVRATDTSGLFVETSFTVTVLRGADLPVLDPFDDGGRTDGADPADINWFLATATTTAAVAGDAVIGTGNALAITSWSLADMVLSPFRATALGPNAGDSLRLGFDFRLSGTWSVARPNIRFGLFYSGGTPVTDGFASANPGDDDDAGYFVRVPVGSADEFSIKRDDTGPLGGPGLSTAFYDDGTAPAVNDTTQKHTASLLLERQADGAVRITASVDGYSGSGVDSSAEAVNVFDEIGLSYGGNSAVTTTIVLDNVTVRVWPVHPPTVAGIAWQDADADGVRGTGEAVLGGAVAELFSSTDAVVGNTDDVSLGTAITDAAGQYLLTGRASGNYYVVFRPPVGCSFSLQDRGGDDTRDSDADSVGRTAILALSSEQNLTGVDAGFSGGSPTFGWALRAGATGDELNCSPAIDAAGNPLVTGRFSGTVDFDPGPGIVAFTSAGDADVFLAKYTSAGALVWARAIGGSEFDQVQGVVVDGTGNIYAAGSFAGTADFDPGPGVVNLTAAGSYWDAFVCKFDASGSLLWARSMGGASEDVAACLAPASDGGAYVAGYFQGSVDFDPGSGTTILASAGLCDAFLAKFDASGNLGWAERFGGTGDERLYDVAVTDSGIYLTGTFQGTADFDPGAGTNNLISAGTNDAYVCKLDLSGNLAWARAMGGSNAEYSYGIAVGADGSVYTTGIFSGLADFDPGPGVCAYTAAIVDAYVSKLDAGGVFVWARTIAGPDYDRAWDISAAADGCLYIGGLFRGTADFDPGPSAFLLTSAGGYDVFVEKMDAAGNMVCAYATGGTGDDRCNGVTLGPDGVLYAAGYFDGTCDFRPGPGAYNLTSAGAADAYILKLFPDHAPSDLILSPAAVAEDRPAGSLVGQFSTSDADPAETFAYALVSGAGDTDNACFSLDAGGTLRTAVPLDYETKPSYAVRVRTTDFAGMRYEEAIAVAVTPVPEVTGRFLFYNNSALDDGDPAATDADYDAIAPAPPLSGHGHAGGLDEPGKELGKQTLLAGQTATFVNYTSYPKGINGIVIAFDDLPAGVTLTASDFAFRVGNSDTPADWTGAPSPQIIRVDRNVVHPNFPSLPDVVTLIWADENPYTPARESGAISNQWLQVTVLANARTGLAANDVFYFGNQIGESGNSSGDTNVDQNDEIGARNHPHTAFNAAPPSDPYDFNRDGKVDQNDEILARNNPASAFTRIQLIATSSMLQAEGLPVGNRVVTLQQTQFAVADFAGSELGEASQTSKKVWLDDDAAEFGWLIDQPPSQNEQVGSPDVSAGRMDLLTAVMHELGHVLGKPDLETTADDLMAGTLGTGMRRGLSATLSSLHEAVFAGEAGGPTRAWRASGCASWMRVVFAREPRAPRGACADHPRGLTPRSGEG